MSVRSELLDLLGRIDERARVGRPASRASTSFLASLMGTSGAGLTRPQRLGALQKIIDAFPNDPLLVPADRKTGAGPQPVMGRFGIVTTNQLIQPVVCAILDWLLEGKKSVRPEAAEALIFLAKGGGMPEMVAGRGAGHVVADADDARGAYQDLYDEEIPW